jgi:hypothetical protein
VRPRATGHVAAPEPTSAGRYDMKLELTWQRVDARSAPYLDLEFVCEGTQCSGCRHKRNSRIVRHCVFDYLGKF